MKRLAISIVAVLVVASLAYAAEDVKTAKVAAVKAYEQGRIAFWEGRVPIYDGYPFYDITLAVDSEEVRSALRERDRIFPVQLEGGARNPRPAQGQGENVPVQWRRGSSGPDL